MQLPHRIVAFLQTVEGALGYLKQRRQLVEGNTALAIDPVGAGQFLARTSGPDDTDARLFVGAKPLLPRARSCFRPAAR